MVVATGERWADGGLRPALENLLGADVELALELDASALVPVLDNGVFRPR